MLSEPVNSEKSDPPYCSLLFIYILSLYYGIYTVVCNLYIWSKIQNICFALLKNNISTRRLVIRFTVII